MTFLIDTGATNSVLNPNVCHPKFIINLKNPILVKTMSNTVNIFQKAVIPPQDFKFPVDKPSEFYIAKFHDKFDGILGMNLLQNSEINFKSKTLKLNNQTISIYFNSKDEKEEEQMISELNKLQPFEINYSHKLEENLRLNHLNPEEKSKLSKLLQKYKSIFFQEGDDLPFTNSIKHEIPVIADKIIYTKVYRYPEAHKQEVNKQIDEMLKSGIIQKSSSPYNSPLWIVPKKTDASGIKKWRLVIDYRKLNEQTVDDKFPIPQIDDILDKLGRSNYFTTIDLAKGFHQIEMCPTDIAKTAFSTNLGHYEFMRMPFGLKNAPATFQRMMNNVLQEFINKICFVYLDDIIVFSTSLQEHLVSLEKIFKTLKTVNLKVQIDKTEFLKKETEFLGHIVTPTGIKPNPIKVKTILDYPIPKTVKQIQSFLGITGYYRKFIPDYAKIAKPLTLGLKKGNKIEFDSQEYIDAFIKLKTLITQNPILIYPDFSKEFVLNTDASNYAIGAVLSQNSKPISYASRTLNTHEVNYSTIEKELLAIVWATKQFRHYLFGRSAGKYV